MAIAASDKRGIPVQAELFPEEIVAPGLCRQLSAVLDCFTSSLDGVDDSRVSGAAAQMTVERLADRARIVALTVLDERRCAHDNAGNTKAALDAALEHERLTNDAAGLLGQSFEGDDHVTVHLLRLAQAGQRRPAVDHHETTAACPLWRAPVLGRHNPTRFAEHLEQVHPGLVCGFDGSSVQGEPDGRHARYGETWWLSSDFRDARAKASALQGALLRGAPRIRSRATRACAAAENHRSTHA